MKLRGKLLLSMLNSSNRKNVKTLSIIEHNYYKILGLLIDIRKHYFSFYPTLFKYISDSTQKKSSLGKGKKIILLLGRTGAGKTTFQLACLGYAF